MENRNTDIAIVDDSPDVLDILEIILTDNGYRVKIYDGAEALLKDVPSSYAPDLFLLDVNLPGMNGLELCRYLKSNRSLSQIPVIFLSGLLGDADKKMGFEVGGEDYITKPFSKVDVLVRIKTHIQLFRSMKDLRLLNTELESRIEERTKELLRAKEEAERANRAKTEFVSNINHEVWTPLNGILGMLSLLKNVSMDRDGKMYLSLAEYSANHLSAIIEDLLDYSQLESKNMRLHCSPMDLRPMMEKLYRIQKPEAEKKGLFLKLIPPETVPPFIGDELRLYQIVINLLSNAIKYSKKGTITIRYWADGEFTVKVRDQGIGIPKDRMEDIFQPFFQLDGTYTKEHHGIGLGLAITRNLVEAMAGSIECESDGTGSCFTVKVPDRAGASSSVPIE